MTAKLEHLKMIQRKNYLAMAHIRLYQVAMKLGTRFIALRDYRVMQRKAKMGALLL